MQTIFDGHNDVLLRLWEIARRGGDPVAAFIGGTETGHLDLPRARAGGMVGGLCAIWVPSKMPDDDREADGSYVYPLSRPRTRSSSFDTALAFAGIATLIEKAGGWTICRSVAEIEAVAKAGGFACVMHMEGCEALGPDLEGLEVFLAAGLRSLGPVWSRPNIFGHGVPFRHPGNPDTGPGLSDAGKRLIAECNRLRIMVDLAHLTEKGFWDVAGISDHPLVASHSNAHALTEIPRNLTDRQLDAVRETGGLVGLNFAVTMLRPDGRRDTDTPLSDMVRHIDHLVARLGIDGVALGSDFDGATIPRAIGSAAGLQRLVEALADAGYGEDELAKLCRLNWLRVLRTTWGET